MTMPANGGADRRTDSAPTALSSTPVSAGNMDANGTVPVPVNSNYRLRLSPKKDHKPENYEDLRSEFSPQLFSSLERHLPPNLLNAPREAKFKHMRDILRRYWNEGERSRVSIPFSLFVIMYSRTLGYPIYKFVSLRFAGK